MKKLLSLSAVVSLFMLSTSCSKESLKPENKATTNAKSQSSGAATSTPTPPSYDHQGGCPNHSGSAG